jgi:hypothetical protein
MDMTSKSKRYEKATKRLKEGSVIEYAYPSDLISLSKERAFGMIVKIDWKPSHARTRVHVITYALPCVISVDICSICRVLIL